MTTTYNRLGVTGGHPGATGVRIRGFLSLSNPGTIA